MESFHLLISLSITYMLKGFCARQEFYNPLFHLENKNKSFLDTQIAVFLRTASEKIQLHIATLLISPYYLENCTIVTQIPRKF